jgi:hypothetical protein
MSRARRQRRKSNSASSHEKTVRQMKQAQRTQTFERRNNADSAALANPVSCLLYRGTGQTDLWRSPACAQRPMRTRLTAPCPQRVSSALCAQGRRRYTGATSCKRRGGDGIHAVGSDRVV